MRLNYKLTLICPVAAILLFVGSGKQKNVVVAAGPDNVIVRDCQDGTERLFYCRDNRFADVEPGDTVNIIAKGMSKTLYNNRTVFNDDKAVHVSPMSLRYTKMSKKINMLEQLLVHESEVKHI